MSIPIYQDITDEAACLVRMSEQISDSAVCTLNNDFRAYRKEKMVVIPVIMAELK